jgi:hypothetical protein
MNGGQCFCYCLDHTNGRECEYSRENDCSTMMFDHIYLLLVFGCLCYLVDCTQGDIDSDICSIDNQILCDESENFAFECRHLCGKC